MLNATWTRAQSTLPLTVAPARQEQTLNPGQEINLEVKFFNRGEVAVPGTVRVADFIVVDSKGTPQLIENSVQTSPRFSAASWATIALDKVVIPANDKIQVPVHITVPTSVKPGGRYLAIYFEPSLGQGTTSENSSITGIGARIASLVYIKIPGEITESAIITRFFTESLQENGPITLALDVLNRGDYHIRPLGVVSLTNMLGFTQDQQKIKEQNIFPDTSRSFEMKLGKKWMFGQYRIDLASSYGEKGHALTQHLYIWVIPWKLITAIILTLTILFIIGKNFYNKIVVREAHLETELEREKREIEELKKQLRKRE